MKSSLSRHTLPRSEVPQLPLHATIVRGQVSIGFPGNPRILEPPMRSAILIPCLFAISSLIQPSRGVPQHEAKDFSKTAMNSAGDRLHELFAAEWDYQMEQHPETASALGDRRWNDRWEDASLSAVWRRHEHDVKTLRRLQSVERRHLTPQDQLNYDLFEREYKERIEGFQYHWYLI